MKQIAFFLIIIILATGAAFAQAPAAPVKCTTTTTYLHVSQTTPSPALATFLGTLANPAGYNYTAPNNHFGDSFPICGCKTCGGTLEIRVRHTSPPDQWSNDGIEVGLAPFAVNVPRVVSQVIWAAGDPPVKTLTFNLDPGKLADVLCRQQTNSPWLDVYVQDDTTVDYIKLTILHP